MQRSWQINMEFFFWREYFSIGIKSHGVWPLIVKLSAASITDENFMLNGFSLPKLWSNLWVVSTWELMGFVEKWPITPVNFNHLPWNFLQWVLSYIQVLSENFAIVAIDREEIYVEIVSDNWGFPTPQDCNELEYPVCDTI